MRRAEGQGWAVWTGQRSFSARVMRLEVAEFPRDIGQADARVARGVAGRKLSGGASVGADDDFCTGVSGSGAGRGAGVWSAGNLMSAAE